MGSEKKRGRIQFPTYISKLQEIPRLAIGSVFLSTSTEIHHMARPRRINITGITQHLVQSGNNCQPSFQDATDFELLKTACAKHSCVVHAYVLMSNHVHLLLTPNQPDGASRVFRDLGRDYVSSRSEPLIESIDALSVGFS